MRMSPPHKQWLARLGHCHHLLLLLFIAVIVCCHCYWWFLVVLAFEFNTNKTQTLQLQVHLKCEGLTRGPQFILQSTMKLDMWIISIVDKAQLQGTVWTVNMQNTTKGAKVAKAQIISRPVEIPLRKHKNAMIWTIQLYKDAQRWYNEHKQNVQHNTKRHNNMRTQCNDTRMRQCKVWKWELCKRERECVQYILLDFGYLMLDCKSIPYSYHNWSITALGNVHDHM